MVWAAWCEANKSLKEEKLMEAEDLKLAKHKVRGTFRLVLSLMP